MDGKRVAVVTGAGQGIGRAYAEALAEDGFVVVVADVNGETAEETAARIGKDGGTAIPVVVDVSDRDSTIAMAAMVREQCGGAHVLVNNAAIYHSMRLDPQMTVDIDYWRRVFGVNLEGALLCTQAIAPMMIDAGWGRIVNQTSTGAYLGQGGHYGCSKLALVALTHGFARELGPHGITVNAIAPGPIDTEATQVTLPAPVVDQLRKSTAVGRLGQPSDLVAGLRFLVSDAAEWMTGQVLIVDGGSLAHV